MTTPGFKRTIPSVARTVAFNVMRVDRDAVALLLTAFGYPTIPPEPPQSGTRRVHRLIEGTTEDQDAEEA